MPYQRRAGPATLTVYFQVCPPSDVANVRPSCAVTVAFRSSLARTDCRSTGSGNAMRTHVRPSIERTTVPPGPTSQQTVGDGASPEVSVTFTPVCCVSHVAPPSTEC